jgi:alkanesulfonate monooxygenase SsuD/methylene tetrahydromethanopterin reductase-like flavin-dependent oxidoreductase (luciferase family)
MYQAIIDPITGKPAKTVLRLADGASFPMDPANADYQVYLAWLAKGNEPLPAPGPTPEEIKRQITAALDAHVEAQARALQYNSAAHLVGYAASTVPDWRAEAEAFVVWRDKVWLAAIAKQAEAMETGTAPSVEDAIEALPKWSGV